MTVLGSSIDADGSCARHSLVPGAEEERLVHTDALPVN